MKRRSVAALRFFVGLAVVVAPAVGAADPPSGVTAWIAANPTDAAAVEARTCDQVGRATSAREIQSIIDAYSARVSDGSGHRAAVTGRLEQLNKDLSGLAASKTTREAEIKEIHDPKIADLEAQVKAAEAAYDKKKEKLEAVYKKVALFELEGAATKAFDLADQLIDCHADLLGHGRMSYKAIADDEARCQELLKGLNEQLNIVDKTLNPEAGKAALDVPAPAQNLTHSHFVERKMLSEDERKVVKSVRAKLNDLRYGPIEKEYRDLEQDPSIKDYRDLERQLTGAKDAKTTALKNDPELTSLNNRKDDLEAEEGTLEKQIEDVKSRVTALHNASQVIRICEDARKSELATEKSLLLADKKRQFRRVFDNLVDRKSRLEERIEKAKQDARENSRYERCRKLYRDLKAKIADAKQRLGAASTSKVRGYVAQWDASGCRLPKNKAAREQEIEKRKRDARAAIRKAWEETRGPARIEWQSAKLRAGHELIEEVRRPLLRLLPADPADYDATDREIASFLDEVELRIQTWVPRNVQQLVVDPSILPFASYANLMAEEEDEVCEQLARAARGRLDTVDRDLATEADEIKKRIADQVAQSAERTCRSLEEKTRALARAQRKDPAAAKQIREKSEAWLKRYGANQGWKNNQRVVEEVRDGIERSRSRMADNLEKEAEEIKEQGCKDDVAAFGSRLTSKADDLRKGPTGADLTLPDRKLRCKLESAPYYVVFDSFLPGPRKDQLPEWFNQPPPDIPNETAQAKQKRREAWKERKKKYIDGLTLGSTTVQKFTYWSPVLSFTGDDVQAAFPRKTFGPGAEFALELHYRDKDESADGAFLLSVAGIYDNPGDAMVASKSSEATGPGVIAIAANGAYRTRDEDGGLTTGRLLTGDWSPRTRAMALDLAKYLMKKGVGMGRCFIATAVYGDPFAPELATLRAFRDDVLSRFRLGRSFIAWYYRNGPALAEWIEDSPRLRAALKRVLDGFTDWLEERERAGVSPGTEPRAKAESSRPHP